MRNSQMAVAKVRDIPDPKTGYKKLAVIKFYLLQSQSFCFANNKINLPILDRRCNFFSVGETA